MRTCTGPGHAAVVLEVDGYGQHHEAQQRAGQQHDDAAEGAQGDSVGAVKVRGLVAKPNKGDELQHLSGQGYRWSQLQFVGCEPPQARAGRNTAAMDANALLTVAAMLKIALSEAEPGQAAYERK